YHWEYDNYVKTAYLCANKAGDLRLVITKTTTKTGLGAGQWSDVIVDTKVGNLTKPMLGPIRSHLKRNSFERTRASWAFKAKWYEGESHSYSDTRKPLKEILADYKAKQNKTDEGIIGDVTQDASKQRLNIIYNSIERLREKMPPASPEDDLLAGFRDIVDALKHGQRIDPDLKQLKELQNLRF
ncbi:unnamed protein product, partial [marine sediment metagenome]